VGWALLALLIATGTCYALLFTLAQYLQQGLGHSALVSGLTLVPWVAAFGAAGQLVRRLPAHRPALAPAAGCTLLTAAYAATSITLFAGHHDEKVLTLLLGLGRARPRRQLQRDHRPLQRRSSGRLRPRHQRRELHDRRHRRRARGRRLRNPLPQPRPRRGGTGHPRLRRRHRRFAAAKLVAIVAARRATLRLR
jgi:hypothetical protein